jgi:hypothetical protein
MTAHFLQPSHHLTGKFLRYQALRSSRFYYVSLRSISIAECGCNTKFFFPRLQGAYKEFQFCVIVKCRQEVRHHFKLAGEDVSRELGITNALRIKDATRQMEKLMTCTLSTSDFNFKLDVMNCCK